MVIKNDKKKKNIYTNEKISVVMKVKKRLMKRYKTKLKNKIIN